MDEVQHQQLLVFLDIVTPKKIEQVHIITILLFWILLFHGFPFFLHSLLYILQSSVISSLAISGSQIGGTDSIYKVYFSGLNFRISPENMAKHMVLTYLHF